jgi:NAD(P)-dependent dehydrogenase (short-subunit alcohol dehydrogenase family)
MFDTAEKEFGGADVLVNNAGLMLLSPIAETTDELFDRLIAINLKGVLNGMREAAVRHADRDLGMRGRQPESFRQATRKKTRFENNSPPAICGFLKSYCHYFGCSLRRR